MKTKILDRSTKVVFVVLASWFSFSCLNYNQYSRQDIALNESYLSSSKFNLLVNSDSRLSREMNALALEQDEILEFMVWSEERRKVLERSILLTRQLINQDPTEIKYWQRLLSLQYEYAPEPQQFSWVLKKLFILDGWNRKTMINLSRYCVPFSFNVMASDVNDKASVPAACNEIINKLALQSNKATLARQIGITEDDLDIVLQRYQ